MTNEKAIMCLEDMRIKVPIPKAAKQARENNEALDVAIKALKNEPHWIPVTERLPAIGKSVLMCDIDGDIYLGHRTQCGYYCPDFYDDRVKNVTAWMPLPKPYVGERKDDETDRR